MVNKQFRGIKTAVNAITRYIAVMFSVRHKHKKVSQSRKYVVISSLKSEYLLQKGKGKVEVLPVNTGV